MSVLDELHARIMAMNLGPTGDPAVDQLLTFYFAYQQIGDDLDHLAGLGGMVHAEMQKEGYSEEMLVQFNLLRSLIITRAGAARMQRVFLAMYPPTPPTA